VGTTYRPWSPEQAYLLPPSPREWLPEGHLAYFLLDVVKELDLGAIETVVQARDPRGEKSYAPQMMVTLLLYAYCTGVFSSRRMERATYEDVAFRVIVAGAQPHFTSINQFRLVHRVALAGLFVQVLQLCRQAGLVKLGHVAIDGSKVKANASKHKAMSYDRMKKAEAQLREKVESLLARAEAIDAEEDTQYGVGQEPPDLPAELKRHEGRRARIREAMAALEREAAQARAEELRERAAEQRQKSVDPDVDATEQRRAATRAAKSEQAAETLDGNDDDEPPAPGASDLPHHRVPTDASGKPTPKAQRNFTDPESRIMVRDGAFVQAYNVQLAVDEANQIIVAEVVTNQAPDAEHFEPVLRRAIDACGAVPERVTGDAGYFSEDNVLTAESLGADPYISVDRVRRNDDGTIRQLPPTPARERMRSKLAEPQGRAIYARRKATVEPVFGQIFAARGFRQFLVRGLTKVRQEWSLLCLTHNLLKLFRARSSARPPRALPSGGAAAAAAGPGDPCCRPVLSAALAPA
jgi:transposase